MYDSRDADSSHVASTTLNSSYDSRQTKATDHVLVKGGQKQTDCYIWLVSQAQEGTDEQSNYCTNLPGPQRHHFVSREATEIEQETERL